MNSTVKDQMKWCFGICCSLCVKNLRLVNFISSLYTAPVQVDDCYRTITSQRFEHTYTLSLMSLISEITQTHSLPDFQVVPNTTNGLKSAENIIFLIYSHWTESLSEVKKINAPIIHYVIFLKICQLWPAKINRLALTFGNSSILFQHAKWTKMM